MSCEHRCNRPEPEACTNTCASLTEHRWHRCEEHAADVDRYEREVGRLGPESTFGGSYGYGQYRPGVLEGLVAARPSLNRVRAAAGALPFNPEPWLSTTDESDWLMPGDGEAPAPEARIRETPYGPVAEVTIQARFAPGAPTEREVAAQIRRDLEGIQQAEMFHDLECAIMEQVGAAPLVAREEPKPPTLLQRLLRAEPLFDRLVSWWRSRRAPTVAEINRALVTGKLGVGTSGLPVDEGERSTQRR